ncbi:hypothetical protein GVAV_002477 [Gurleya vavrai]
MLTLLEDSTTIKIVAGDKCLVLNRSTGYGSIGSFQPAINQKGVEFHGIYGLINLRKHSYIMCVTRSKKIGNIFSKDVFEIQKVRYIKFQTLNTKANDRKDIKKLNYFFKQPGLYYSEYPIYKSYVDENCHEIDFYFNYSLQKNFKECFKIEVDEIVLRCMQGYFKNEFVKNINYAMISRRCWRNVGMRFMQRGCDKKGFVANFVESEQIMHELENKEGVFANIVSFVQVRGSIPLKWKNKIAFKLNPTMIVEETEIMKEADQIFRKHYKNLFYVNLIQNKNLEKGINDIYKREMLKNNISCINFDYKNKGLAKCVKTRTQFVKDLDDIIDTFGITANLDTKQSGIIRTNCIDCLDRTNIVQFLIGNEVLKTLLEKIGVDEHKQFYDLNRTFWYENGNILSIQYSGTPSLQSQVITNGQPSISGKLRDGYFSLKRYALNRFYHGNLQDGYQLATGNFVNLKRKPRLRINNKIYFTFFLLTMCLFHYLTNGKRSEKHFFTYGNITIFLGFFTFYLIFFDCFINYPQFIE